MVSRRCVTSSGNKKVRIGVIWGECWNKEFHFLYIYLTVRGNNMPNTKII